MATNTLRRRPFFILRAPQVRSIRHFGRGLHGKKTPDPDRLFPVNANVLQCATRNILRKYLMNRKTREFWTAPKLSAEAHRRWERERHASSPHQGGRDNDRAEAATRGDSPTLDVQRAEAARMYTEFKLAEAPLWRPNALLGKLLTDGMVPL